MKRIVLLLIALVALAAVACGGSSNKAAPTGTAGVTSAGTAASGKASSSATTSSSSSSPSAGGGDGAQAVSGIFNTLFSSGALNGGSSGSEASNLPAGDESLKQYLLTQGDVPSAYKSQGEFTYQLPDSISKNGTMDMATSVFMSGDAAAQDPSNSTILMSMVIKPSDLTKLGEQLSQAKNLSEQDLRDAVTQGAGELGGAIKITNVKVLDASGLGEGGFGMGMTIDMSALMNALTGAFGASGNDSTTAVAKVSVMTMRMYFFAKGDYVAGIMRMGFSDTLPSDVDEKALATTVEGKLP